MFRQPGQVRKQTVESWTMVRMNLVAEFLGVATCTAREESSSRPESDSINRLQSRSQSHFVCGLSQQDRSTASLS